MADAGPDEAELQRLKDVELRYQALFETIGPAVLLMRGPACIDCNPATLELFGLERREQILGKTPIDFAPEVQPNGKRSIDMVRENIECALANGSHVFEWEAFRTDGTRVLMEVRFTPCGPPSEGLFLSIAVDISARKQAERSLQLSEARFRTLIEHAAEGVAIVDGNLEIVYANPAMEKLTGYGGAELLGRAVQTMHPPESLDAVMAAVRDARGQGERVETVLPIVRKDGVVVEAEVLGVPVELEGRRCLLGFFTDLTERRRIEAERLRAQKLEALGTLAGGLAHDFNNLLQGVFGFLAAARDAREEEREALLGEANEALEMATRLTSQLLTFSRGGAPVKKVVSIGRAVERVTRFALSGSAVSAQFEWPEALWSCECDEGQLEQVVQNLVLNAVEAMPQGGAIRVKGMNVEAPGTGLPVDLAPGRYVALSVADAGAGIAPELLSRIFDPYFTTKPRGSGLGLATAHSIVRQHGGMLTVASQPGAGSTFTLYLPADAVEPKKLAGPATRVAAKPARILVMDDEPMVRRVCRTLISNLGHEVETAADGAAALSLFGEAAAGGRPFDLVVLDLTVPGGMGGLATLEALKAEDPSVKAIVSSGYSNDSTIANFRAHGFAAVLAKPYTIETLERTLAEVLARPRE